MSTFRWLLQVSSPISVILIFDKNYKDRQLIGRIDYLESQLGEVQTSIKSLQASRDHHAVKLVTQNAKLSTQKQEAMSEVESLRVDMLAMEQRMVGLLKEQFGEVNSKFTEMNSTNVTFFQRIEKILDTFFKRSS
jgi:DNA anti-recombination protein RmuC